MTDGRRQLLLLLHVARKQTCLVASHTVEQWTEIGFFCATSIRLIISAKTLPSGTVSLVFFQGSARLSAHAQIRATGGGLLNSCSGARAINACARS